MNIFISHSSKDKWAARRISEDLISLGTKTFLDEKDIETGESIDVSLVKNLTNCTDFLIILSPASIKSEWVLLELGGAIALGKKIIPILLYVGANEMPKAINLKLARDINSIQLYYDEVKQSISGKRMTKKAKPRETFKHSFKAGSRVLVVSTRPNDVVLLGITINWTSEMDIYLGKEFTIGGIADKEFGDSYTLVGANKASERPYIFAKEWLIPTK
jgi:hypothetical protein